MGREHAGKIEYLDIKSGRNSSLIIALFKVETMSSSVSWRKRMGHSFENFEKKFKMVSVESQNSPQVEKD